MNFDTERALWLIEHYNWLGQNLEERENERPFDIVLPTKDFYPYKHSKSHDYALLIFEKTKELMEIADWPCVLESEESAYSSGHEHMGELGLYGSMPAPSEPAGTFSIEKKQSSRHHLL